MHGKKTYGPHLLSSPVMVVVVLTALAVGGVWLYVGVGASPSDAPPAPPVLDEAPARPAGLDVPEGMAYVPGGTTLIGNDVDKETYNTHHQSDPGATFAADVDPFFMDKHPVTVAQFREFVEATGYQTEAERFGDAGVMDAETLAWELVKGATWEQPRGPDASPAPDNHPVTQVSWNDAVAYAGWANRRLPTEIEWEHAARNARNSRDRYAWGNEVVVDGEHQANIWQQHLPAYTYEEGEYQHTSPVGAFGETELGLTDMGGNVWEWCQDWYRPYSERERPYTPTQHSSKVQRGGSFQCDECHGYTVYARSYTTPETSLFHVGFRTVKDLSDRRPVATFTLP